LIALIWFLCLASTASCRFGSRDTNFSKKRQDSNIIHRILLYVLRRWPRPISQSVPSEFSGIFSADHSVGLSGKGGSGDATFVRSQNDLRARRDSALACRDRALAERRASAGELSGVGKQLGLTQENLPTRPRSAVGVRLAAVKTELSLRKARHQLRLAAQCCNLSRPLLRSTRFA
jgi:hypothetical protein